jgi:hypothetical protein
MIKSQWFIYQAWTRSYISISARCVIANRLSLAGCVDALKIITILLLLSDDLLGSFFIVVQPVWILVSLLKDI